MKRNMPQDIVPGKRSIRDITLPNRPGRSASGNTSGSTSSNSTNFDRPIERPAQPRQVTQDIKTAPPRPRERPTPIPMSPQAAQDKEYSFDYDIDQPKKKSRTSIFALGGVFVLALAFGIVMFFSSARVTITPKSETVPADLTLTALKDQASGQFGYQIVSVSATADKDVPATGSQQVSTKATGSIVVFNTSNADQKLVATTRFQTSDGLVFRATSAVSVPKGGSATVAVIADQPGDKYNVGLSDFTLPGLAGTAQFKNIYGRSTASMSGGFVGTQRKVSDADTAAAATDIDTALRTSLQSQIASQLPANFILYPQSISYDMGTVSQKTSATTTGASASSVTLTKTGSAQAVIFDRTVLSQAILKALAASTTPPDATVTNLDDLLFGLKNPPVLTKNYTGTISFELKGDIHAVWNFDAVTLKSDLLGLKKSNLDALLQAKYPSIDSATAAVFPVWNQSFPSDPNKITVTTSAK